MMAISFAGMPLLDQLLLDVLEEVEGLVAALEGVGEDDLRQPWNFSLAFHRLKTSSTHRLTLDPGRSGILGSTRRRSMAAFLARPKRTRGTWLLCHLFFPGKAVPGVPLGLDPLDEAGQLLGAVKLQVDGLPALDLRPLHVHVLGKDDIGRAPPHGQDLRAVDVFGEPLDHLEIPARRLLGVLDHLPEVGGEGVEVLGVELLQEVRADVAEHGPDLGEGVGNRRPGGQDDVLAPGPLGDFLGL